MLDYSPSHVPGLLGQVFNHCPCAFGNSFVLVLFSVLRLIFLSLKACVFFMMGEREENIKKAQEFYKKALENYKVW